MILANQKELPLNGGSSSTLENDPGLEFQKMREAIHHLFELAKNEIALLYRNVVHQVTLLEARLKHQNISQQFLEQLTQIKKQAELAIPFFSQKLFSALRFPEFLKKVCSALIPQPDEYGMTIPRYQNKRTKTSISVSRHEKPSNLNTPCRKETKKIGQNNIQKLGNLQFLQGDWSNLQTLSVQGKSISQMCSFSQLKANMLQRINLAGNQIRNLSCFIDSKFPALLELNLSNNRIKYLGGIQKTCFPRLVILNLSMNFICSVQVLNKCAFPELLELHLEKNSIENVEPLNECNFSKLEVLNLDKNRLTNVSSFAQLPFYGLKVLSFSENSISEIQFASRARLRRLQGFMGHNNKIKSIEPLANACFPLLREIVLHNNEIDDISCVKRMDFARLTGFDLEYNQIGRQTVGCFITNDKGWREARKRFPFILI